MDFTTAVIISTYNNPIWLEKVLWGYEHQTYSDFDVILADDGSGPATRALIERFQSRGILRISHVWHEDNGFQKSKILNKALETTQSDYLIFTDQDCIPREDFVSTHIRMARKGYFLSGGYYKLNLPVSTRVREEDVSNGFVFSNRWLKEQGQPIGFKNTKLWRNALYARLMNSITPANASWNGCNASGWRSDMIRINGYNEDMQYGGQDREFGERLHNLGIQSKQIRYSAICVHLDHKRPYKTKKSIQKNKAIRRSTRTQNIVRTPNGIQKLS